MKSESIKISESIVIESGPAKKKAIATEELLSDAVTAGHYKAGMRKITKPDGSVVEKPYVDAMNKPIVLGEEMTYLDWLGAWVWYVYQEREVGIDAAGRPVGIDEDGYLVESDKAVSTQKRFVVAAVKQTRDEAIAFATSLKE
jgi:hypothetical protein